MENNTSIIKTMPSNGEVVYMHGVAQGALNGDTIAGTTIDI